MDTTPPPIIAPMIDAALKAAHIALRRRAEGLHIDTKNEDGRISRYTNGDTQAEQLICDTLQKATPQLLALPELQGYHSIGFITEETFKDASRRKEGLHFVIDPIDGTHGYSRQNDDVAPWCVSIGLEKEGKTIASVVYEAAQSEYNFIPGQKTNGCNPNHPRGKIFWATADEPHAHRIDPPKNGFTVTPSPEASYAEVQRDVQWQLAAIPALQTDARGQDVSLDARTIQKIPKRFDIGDFAHDEREHRGRDDSYRSYMSNYIAQQGFAADRSYSCVASLMRVADGRIGGFIHGNCSPWDESAARLIVAKSGVPIVQYETPKSSGQRSFLITTSDQHVFKPLIDKVMTMPGAPSQLMLAANTPLAARVAQPTSAGIAHG